MSDEGLGWTGEPEDLGVPPQDDESFESHAMPQGNAGTLAETVPRLVAAVRHARGHPFVRQTALRIIATCGHSTEARIVALYNWVRDAVRYIPDPNDTEFVTPPAKLLELVSRGEAWEDCESMVALLASLLESIGIHARFVLTQNGPQGSEEYTHIYVEALVAGRDGGWMALDPTPPYREAGTPMDRQRGRLVVPVDGGPWCGVAPRIVVAGLLALAVGYVAWRLGSA